MSIEIRNIPEYSGSAPEGLTHWGRVTHICISKLSIIGSDNGLSPDRRQTIIWTNAEILKIRTLGTNFNEILIKIHIFSFTNIHLKMSSGKWRPFCLGLNVLTHLLQVCCWTRSALVQVMARCLFDTKPLLEPMLTYCQSDTYEHTSEKFELKYKTFHSQKCIWKCRLRNGSHFVHGWWVHCSADMMCCSNITSSVFF